MAREAVRRAPLANPIVAMRAHADALGDVDKPEPGMQPHGTERVLPVGDRGGEPVR